MDIRYFLGRRIEADYNLYAAGKDRRWVWAPNAGSSGEWFWAPQLYAAPWGD